MNIVDYLSNVIPACACYDNIKIKNNLIYLVNKRVLIVLIQCYTISWNHTNIVNYRLDPGIIRNNFKFVMEQIQFIMICVSCNI